MAYYSKNGSGIDSSAYIYVQLQVTRTDYPTYSRFSVKSVAVSDTGTSSFIRGQVTTNQGGNSWTAATGWKDVSYNGTTTLATATFDVARGASDKTAHIGAYAEGGGTGIYSGGTDYAWLDVTVPKVLAPNAPTGCTATYVSDSQASVSWTNGTADTDHPRDATLVERRDGSNDWAQIASASGTASSYSDNGISPNGQYQYRVRAKNVAGYSDYSASGSIYTTPAAPTSVTLDKTAATTVQIDVVGAWSYPVTYDIEATYDNGATWSSVVTSTSLPYSASVNAGTVQFRVRATRGELLSAWTLSASLVTICPPLAPTIVQAPANPTANGSTVVVAWSPNHPDGSSQTSVQVKMTRPNGTSVTYTLSTATSWTSPALVTDGTYSVQVHTKGLDPSYGEWSQAVSWVVANPPAVVITSPATDGTDVVALPLNVAWTVTDSTGVSTQRIIIEGDGGEILNRTLAGDVRTVALNASDVALENGQTYTIRLRVMGGSGLVTEQTRIFDVAWLAPAAPVLQLTEGEGRSATIDVVDTHYSESGSTIAVDGSAIADSFTVFGASVQDGTPTPSAPVAIESISDNIFPNDPAYWVIGTFDPATGADLATPTRIKSTGVNVSAGTYTIDRLPLSSDTMNVVIYAYAEDGTYLSVESVTAWIESYPATVTFTDARHVRFGVRQNDNANVTTVDEWLAKAAFSFGNGDMRVESIGENLFELSHLRLVGPSAGGKSVSADGLISAVNPSSDARSVRFETCDYYASLPAGTYSVTAFVETGTTSTNARFMAYAHDGTELAGAGGSSTFVAGGTKTITFTLDTETVVGIFLKIYGATMRIVLKRGDAPTEYIPAQGSAYPIDLQGNSLCSLSDGTRDELRVSERKVLVQRVQRLYFDGSDMTGWAVQGSYASSGGGYYVYTNPDNDSTVTLATSNARTNRLTWANGGLSVSANNTGKVGYANNPHFFRIRPEETTAAQTVSALQTWLQSNPLEVLLPISTPQEIDLGAVSDMPFIPEDGEMWVDGTEMEASLRPADYAGQPTIESVDVQRVNADGTAWTVATGLTVGGSCIDPLPPLGVPVTYRATSSAASGSTASGEFTETFGGRDWVLNFGNAAQEHVALMFNPRSTLSLDQGGESYHFADGGAGNGLPVWYGITDRDMSGSLRFDTNHYGDTDVVIDLCNRYPVAWLRDPYGHRWRAHVKPSLSHDYGGAWPVTLNWDAVRFKEAW